MTVVSRGDCAINERYRPMRLSELIGNERNKAGLTAWMARGDKRSRALLLCGSSSCGKTTTARILAMGLNCERGDSVDPCLECPSCRAAMEGNAFHIIEHNMSDSTGKDAVSEIVDSMYESCITGRNKVYILDEVQKASNSSQNLLLKTVEKPPDGVYIIFCTTEADALLPALKNRCEKYVYSLPTDRDIAALLKDVVKQENIEMTDEQKIQFFDYVKGHPYRDILFALEQFNAGCGMEGLNTGDPKSKVDLFELVKQIMYNGNFDYYKQVLDSGQNIEFESMRRLMRGVCGREIERNGVKNPVKSALYYDLLTYVNENKFFDTNPRPDASALVFRICAELKDNLGK